MIPLISYLLSLKSLPIMSWTALGLSQTMEQDFKEDLIPILRKCVKADFKGSIDDFLWAIYHTPEMINTLDWKVQKHRLILSFQRGEEITIPSEFTHRRLILEKMWEYKKFDPSLFNFDTLTFEDSDETLPF